MALMLQSYFYTILYFIAMLLLNKLGSHLTKSLANCTWMVRMMAEAKPKKENKEKDKGKGKADAKGKQPAKVDKESLSKQAKPIESKLSSNAISKPKIPPIDRSKLVKTITELANEDLRKAEELEARPLSAREKKIREEWGQKYQDECHRFKQRFKQLIEQRDKEYIVIKASQIPQ
jgi:hypothetical protein